MTERSKNKITKLIGTLTKTAVILCLTIMLLTLFSGCSKKQCAYCESSEVKYEAFFVPSGTSEYLCEKCYQRKSENPTFDKYWIVKPLHAIKTTKHNGLYNNK